MKLKCSLCDVVKISQIVGDPESSFKELCNKLTKHFTIKHPKELSEFQKEVQILATKTLSCFSMISTIDLESEETDDYIKKNFERESEEILELMGWVDEEGEEEDSDYEEEGEDLEEDNNELVEDENLEYKMIPILKSSEVDSWIEKMKEKFPDAEKFYYFNTEGVMVTYSRNIIEEAMIEIMKKEEKAQTIP